MIKEAAGQLQSGRGLLRQPCRKQAAVNQVVRLLRAATGPWTLAMKGNPEEFDNCAHDALLHKIPQDLMSYVAWLYNAFMPSSKLPLQVQRPACQAWVDACLVLERFIDGFRSETAGLSAKLQRWSVEQLLQPPDAGQGR